MNCSRRWDATYCIDAKLFLFSLPVYFSLSLPLILFIRPPPRMSLCHTSTKPILILVDRHWLWVLHACGYCVILHTCLPLYKTFWADATSIQPDTCIKMTSTTTTIVADRPRCQHSLFDVPLVDGHLVFGCAKLFAARHRTQR